MIAVHVAAGIYVPLLVKAVVEGNAHGHKPHINIKVSRARLVATVTPAMLLVGEGLAVSSLKVET